MALAATLDQGEDITRYDAGLRCGAAWLGFGHQGPFDTLQTEGIGDFRGDRLDFYAECSARDDGLFPELLDYRLHCRGWDGEPDAD